MPHPNPLVQQAIANLEALPPDATPDTLAATLAVLLDAICSNQTSFPHAGLYETTSSIYFPRATGDSIHFGEPYQEGKVTKFLKTQGLFFNQAGTGGPKNPFHMLDPGMPTGPDPKPGEKPGQPPQL